MKTHRFIILVGVIGFLMSGCSTAEDQKIEAEARAEIGEELKKLWEETGLASHFAESNSSSVNTVVFIGNSTNYTAETVAEKSDGQPLILKIKPKDVSEQN